MALAFLRYEYTSGNQVRFHADIGHNRYYRYRIGRAEAVDGGGYPALSDPSHESELIGPLRPSALGRTILEIPLDLFGRRSRFVQLVSYRAEPDIGAAISDIVEIPFGVLPPGLPKEDELPDDLEDEPGLSRPVRQFSIGWENTNMHLSQKTARIPINLPGKVARNGNKAAIAYSNNYQAARALDYRAAYAAPFAYREARYSDAMFLQAIGSFVSSALPIVKQVIGGLGGAEGIANILGGLLGGGGKAPAPAPNASGANPQSLTPELARQIAELIRTLAAPQPAGPASAPAQKAAGSSLAKSLSEYSHGMIAPALLAALPALMPILEKAMNPETINAVLSNVGPKATLGAVADAVKDIGGLNVEAHKNMLDHIQNIMPSSDTSPMLNHLLAVSESLSEPSILPSYRRVEMVQVHFLPQTPVMLRGGEQLVYSLHAARGLVFPLTVDTPRPIRSATLYLIVKEAETLHAVIEKQWVLANVGSGALSEAPRLDPGELGRLASGGSYLFCAYLVWKTRKGEKIGASRTQAVQLIGQYVYQGVESDGEIVPLNDVDKYRAYWHKVWQESFTREKRRWEWDCKYYYVLNTAGGKSERLETVTEETPRGGRRISGRLKSGLSLSPSDLNALLPQISQHPTLDAPRLEALASPAAVAAFGRAARSKVEFRGSEGNSVALWIYPEMRITPVVLLNAVSVDENGQVRELVEETVHFPIPTLAHFVGVTTEKNPFPALDAPVEEI